MGRARTSLTIRPEAFAFLLAAPLVFSDPAVATTKTIWSIYFSTDWHPCGDGNLLTPAIPPATMPGIKPCSYFHPLYPWDQCKPITIIGYDMIHQVSDQTMGTWAVTGSGHGGDGADVFATTAGTGNTSSRMMFPPGTGIPQGPIPDKPGYAHIDIYGGCSKSGETQRVIVSIYYTSP
jgi:hypothetical protein